MNNNKHSGSDFQDYLLEGLRDSDELVFLHVKDALDNPSTGEAGDYSYLIKALGDVAKARGQGDFLESTGMSRQGLHKILKGECVPSIQNVTAMLDAIGLRFSVEKVRAILENEPASVTDVAQFASSLLPRNATFMKLQKIVYYAQAESLVRFNRPLFNEKIEAWAAGPVVRELFEKHRGLRHLNSIVLGEIERLSAEQKACIIWAVEKYGRLDGDTLSHLTHVELPWKDARKGLPETAHSDREITLDSILRYYSNLPDYNSLDAAEK